MGLRVAVLGSTGLVGHEILRKLESSNLPIDELVPLASRTSTGTPLRFHDHVLEVREATRESFDGIDIVLASAGGSVSTELLPAAVDAGAVCIDNTSAFRMADGVPLVVPEVNPHRLEEHRGIIANPNCSTIQLVVILAALHRAAGLERVRVATYQSVSGAGRQALAELEREAHATLAGETIEREQFPHPIAFNVLPHVDVFQDDGSTREEWKMRVETRKILELDLPIDATCVRVPVYRGHSEAVWIETKAELAPEDARRVLAETPGVRVVDDPAANGYPTARGTAFHDEVFVGRIRRDHAAPNALSLWIVADNLRKGAATNAVQIAEVLHERGLLAQ